MAEPLPKARMSCGAGQAAGWVQGSGTFPVSSSWAGVTLPMAGDGLRDRLRKESCGELAVGPAIMPRTMRPGFGLLFSPVLFTSRVGSECSFSILSHAEGKGGLSPDVACFRQQAPPAQVLF